MWAVGDGIPVDEAALEERIAAAIDAIVGRQLDSGVTVVNDGEMSKPSYATSKTDSADLVVNRFRITTSKISSTSRGQLRRC